MLSFAGVTTVVDAGSTGAMTFNGLRKFICDESKTRVLVKVLFYSLVKTVLEVTSWNLVVRH